MNESAPALASLPRRFVATLIDVILVPSLTIALVIVTNVMEDAEAYVNSLWILKVLTLAIVSYLLVNGYLLWKHGQTVGKAICRIRMVTADKHQTAPFWKLVCIRAPFFPILFLGAAPPLTILPVLDLAFIFGKQRRCVHDFAAGTQVVNA